MVLLVCNGGVYNARAFPYPLDVGLRYIGAGGGGLGLAGDIATMVYLFLTSCVIGRYSAVFLRRDPTE